MREHAAVERQLSGAPSLQSAARLLNAKVTPADNCSKHGRRSEGREACRHGKIRDQHELVRSAIIACRVFLTATGTAGCCAGHSRRLALGSHGCRRRLLRACPDGPRPGKEALRLSPAAGPRLAGLCVPRTRGMTSHVVDRGAPRACRLLPFLGGANPIVLLASRRSQRVHVGTEFAALIKLGCGHLPPRPATSGAWVGRSAITPSSDRVGPHVSPERDSSPLPREPAS